MTTSNALDSLAASLVDAGILEYHRATFRYAPHPGTYEIGDAVLVIDHYWPGVVVNIEYRRGQEIAAVAMLNADCEASVLYYNLGVDADRRQLCPCSLEVAQLRWPIDGMN